MLDPDEASAVAARFGVPDAQVRRDHLVSHLLAAVAGCAGDDVVFFGGTALARTHLPHGRLSEDVDLLSEGPRAPVAALVADVLPGAVRRTHGQLSWDRSPAAVREVEPSVLSSDDGLSVRFQVLSAAHYSAWPTERRALHQRYSDSPVTEMRVPTLESFVGMKLAAWCNRAAPRDLYDLWMLAEVGALTRFAADLFAELGGARTAPQPWMFANAPRPERWRAQLAGQTRVRVGAETALAQVRAAWAAVVQT